ncbi:MAG: hypothetical protein ACQET5_10850 [Halobacteriota archaeon]
MKDYTAPTVETYGSVEELSETVDGGYGNGGGPPNEVPGNPPV